MKVKLFLRLNQYFVFFRAHGGRRIFMIYNFQAINRRFIIHSQDMLPILTDRDLSITDTTVDTAKSFSIKLSKIQFKRLPKPYDTNCQIYGNRSRFQCLNECYFDGYMNSNIKCIPNSESLYTFEINDKNENRSKIFCESDDENSIIYLNIKLNEKCFDKCLVSCDETYFSSDYEQVQYIGNFEAPSYKIILKESYYKRIIFSVKMTFFSLVISIANIWCLWHGINFQLILDLFLRYSKFVELIEFSFLFGKKIIFHFIEFEKKVKINFNVKVMNGGSICESFIVKYALFVEVIYEYFVIAFNSLR